MIFFLTRFFSVSPVFVAFVAAPASSVGCASAWYAHGRGFDPPVQQHPFVEIGHEIFSTAFRQLFAKGCALG